MKIAAVQAEPAWLDLDGGVKKVCSLIKEAAANGAELIGFPEVFLPGFPFVIYTRPPDSDFILQYQKNSMELNSPQYNEIRKCVRDAGIWCVLGFSERAGSTLYLAQSFIAPTGEVALHRRKIRPTHVERYVYGDGGAESLQTSIKTEKGVVISGLNCWENLLPLLRYHTYAQGAQIHVAGWPFLAPAGEGVPNATTADTSGDVVTRMMSLEGGCFSMVASSITTLEGSKKMGLVQEAGMAAAGTVEGGGFAAIYAPDGRKIASSQDQFTEELVYAECDLDEIHRAKQMFDVTGHYARPELLALHVQAETFPVERYTDGRHNVSLTSKILPLGL